MTRRVVIVILISYWMGSRVNAFYEYDSSEKLELEKEQEEVG